MGSTKLLWLNAENMFEWWFHDVWWSWVKQWNPSSCDIKVFMGETHSQNHPACIIPSSCLVNIPIMGSYDPQ
jgi:hypothetical protein